MRRFLLRRRYQIDTSGRIGSLATTRREDRIRLFSERLRCLTWWSPLHNHDRRIYRTRHPSHNQHTAKETYFCCPFSRVFQTALLERKIQPIALVFLPFVPSGSAVGLAPKADTLRSGFALWWSVRQISVGDGEKLISIIIIINRSFSSEHAPSFDERCFRIQSDGYVSTACVTRRCIVEVSRRGRCLPLVTFFSAREEKRDLAKILPEFRGKWIRSDKLFKLVLSSLLIEWFHTWWGFHGVNFHLGGEYKNTMMDTLLFIIEIVMIVSQLI